ncbi:O-antigen ligase family protein [Methylobacterium sp. E-045]|uniref:O-antigen ligase family protein n=1 Tax=Methylobacterium sp. E-045 TaxID=2836575 RepID=UPI001FBA8CE2|nr:O-antigen ligase family protein [Methylobacterium sp. E-045]MCJ2132193.1 O-antigen ligase family protein [Methylobacterium sp. E-045]
MLEEDGAAIGPIMKDRFSDLATNDPSTMDHSGASGRAAILEPGSRRLEMAYAIFAILVYLGVQFGLNDGDGSGELAVDAMATINQAIVLLVGGCFVLRHHRACLAALPVIWPFLLFLALAAMSSLWSQAPLASLRRSLTLATLMMFAVYAHAVLGTLLLCRLQVAAMWIVAFASFAVAAIVPASGFDIGGYAGAVRGVFTQKNSLGDSMVVGTVALSGIVLCRHRVTLADLVSLALALATIILAQATTSLLLCMAIVVVTTGILLVLDGRALAVFGLLTGLIAASLAVWIVYVVPVDLFDLLGKDSSLTGRAEVWTAVRRAIEDGSVLGYGYSAFWLPETPAAQNVWAALGWTTPSAHSGYLEVRLELGLPGLLLVAILGIASLAVAVRAWWAGDGATAAWALIVLMIIAVVNYDESSMPRPDIHLLQWILAFAACTTGDKPQSSEGQRPNITLATSEY